MSGECPAVRKIWPGLADNRPAPFTLAGRCLGALLMICLRWPTATAGPPFMTDDPEPVPFRHYEYYLFSTVDRSTEGYDAMLPAMEFNVGAAPNLQLHIVAPLQFHIPNEGSTTFGLGDMELGVKYRFLAEKGWRPQVGIFPMLEIPTGDSQRNLGNGSLWTKLPLWIQKIHGPWTSYGGGGYIINHAPGMRDHFFFGWQLQREINQHWTLGGEWFNPGKESPQGRNTHMVNLGGFYNFREGFSFLFTVGHSFVGDAHLAAYGGLYWTWGDRKSVV
jgi:hypothetical protein